MIDRNCSILITGSNGLVGAALVNELKKQGYSKLIPLTRQSCDLTNFESVRSFFRNCKPDVVFHLAASVYGIGGNLMNRASIFLDNVLMNTHVIEASQQVGVRKIVAMGTVAAYPELKITPIQEHHIWEGPPHGSESSYGHVKRAMLAQLQAYQENYGLEFAYPISTNLYGPNDRFDVQQGHVIPSLIYKFYEASKKGEPVVIWGNGTAARDFLYSKDLARALVLIMNQFQGAINVASGVKTLIKRAVDLLTDFFGMGGRVTWDPSMPNGREYNEIDLSKIRQIGFSPSYSFEKGLLETLDWFTSNCEQNLIRC